MGKNGPGMFFRASSACAVWTSRRRAMKRRWHSFALTSCFSRCSLLSAASRASTAASDSFRSRRVAPLDTQTARTQATGRCPRAQRAARGRVRHHPGHRLRFEWFRGVACSALAFAWRGIRFCCDFRNLPFNGFSPPTCRRDESRAFFSKHFRKPNAN